MEQPHVMLAILPGGVKIACKDEQYRGFGGLADDWTLPAVLFDYREACKRARLAAPRITVVHVLPGGKYDLETKNAG